ncbi:MAG TPA: sigma-70 family RNA polymerase sigma factor [Vicinamibacterales bacterium]|nr:sigma-70 family RNA polymerase sigma factor [Vicinamibacterales bacterium]
MAQPARVNAPLESKLNRGDFAAIVLEHQSMVFSLAVNFLRDRQVAEEVAQDVFLQLHKNLHAIASGEHLVFWLRRVTSQRCIDYSRRRKWSQVSLEDVPEPAARTVARDPWLSRRLRQLVDSLPPAPRMVVVLRYQEDLTPQEIADLLAIPIATVKSHLQRSLAMLREKVLRVFGDVVL